MVVVSLEQRLIPAQVYYMIAMSLVANCQEISVSLIQTFLNLEASNERYTLS